MCSINLKLLVNDHDFEYDRIVYRAKRWCKVGDIYSWQYTIERFPLNKVMNSSIYALPSVIC